MADREVQEVQDDTQKPWITGLFVAVCGFIFLGLVYKQDYESWDTLAKFGYVRADFIWKGQVWGLLTSAFIHIEFWHLALNVYWLWTLGSRLERAIGSLRFVAFFLASAFVSSSFQLAVSDSTGIGASGVIYAIFGFMWPLRHRYPSFKEVLNFRTIQLFVFWIGVCVVITWLGVLNVGNASHISGLMFGAAVAGVFAAHQKRILMSVAPTALVVLAVVPLFWCPWSAAWLSEKAYEAHAVEQYDVAILRYTEVIAIDPENSWALLNRSYAYEALGEYGKAKVDFQRAHSIDPSIEAEPKMQD